MINLYLTVLEAEKSKIKVSADSVSGKFLLPSSSIVFSPHPHRVEEARGLSVILFVRSLVPFMSSLLS
jgi:hypothetical protein